MLSQTLCDYHHNQFQNTSITPKRQIKEDKIRQKNKRKEIKNNKRNTVALKPHSSLTHLLGNHSIPSPPLRFTSDGESGALCSDVSPKPAVLPATPSRQALRVKCNLVKHPPANAGDTRDVGGFDPWVGKIPWRRA